MDALKIVYETTCAECHSPGQQTFEGFQRAGWVCRPERGKPEWFCPACVYGLKRTSHESSQAGEGAAPPQAGSQERID